ncbi:MAG: RNA polymerase sigma factor [Deltaproteobacteria bacterium]|nr:RNA polymerase sigma factor [Deltaproteobacteria bacterium]
MRLLGPATEQYVAATSTITPWAIAPWFRPAAEVTLKNVSTQDGEAIRSSRPPEQAGSTDPVDESAALVARSREGDRGAFRKLFERHRNDVARLAYRMVGPRPDLEDLVQEVFVQVHKSLRDFRGEARFSTWLHRVTVNVVLMHRRAEKSRPVLTEELPAGTLEDTSSSLPDAEVERRTRIAAFFRLVEEIAEKKRVVFVLHDLEGMAPSEIAEVVDAPILTVRTRLFYARRELEEKMRAHPLLSAIIDREGGFAGVTGQTRRASK